MTPRKPDPATAPLEPQQAQRNSTLKVVSALIAIAATTLVPLVHLSTSNPLETWSTVLVAVLGWVTWGLLHKGYFRHLPLFMVLSVLTAASLAVLAFGSVRTAAGFLFVAAVAGAGVFLDRKALIAAVLYSVASLGLLTLAEYRQWLQPPDFGVGLKVWLTHSVTLVVVAVMVFYSRSRAQLAFEEQMAELERRKRTEQERDRSQERFGRIFHSSPSPMLAQSAHSGVILDANPAFERCYGYSKEQLLGRTDGFLWADADERATHAQKLFGTRRVDQQPALGLRADGSVFEVSVSSELSQAREDKLIITIVTDMSAQNAALDSLRRSEARFAKAFNFAPLKLSITRLSDFEVLEVNAGAGQTRDKASGTFDWLDPQQRSAFVASLRTKGHVHGRELQMKNTAGAVIDVRIWAELIEIDHEACMLTSTIDISQEKRREALLLGVAQGVSGQTGEAFFSALTRHMAQSLEADVVIVGELLPESAAAAAAPDMRTLSVWSGGAPADNFIYALGGAPCGETLKTPALCAFTENLCERFPTEKLLSDAGLQAYVGQSLRDHDHSPIGVLTAMWTHPIVLTPQLQALMSIFASRANAELVRLMRDREILRLNTTLEQRVQARTAELAKLNAELDSFAYSVSHDLRSPLRAIDGFTRLLGEQLEGRLQPDELQLFHRVLASTQRMSTLIADLLALARVSQGLLERVPTDLSAMAEAIMKNEQAKPKARALRWRIDPGLLSHCDPRLARIALENLLGNAIKYTRDQADTLIEFGHDGDGFFVRDNGVGFNMAYADKLFKPFQRLHMPTEFEGTGIGLATVHRIVERHGGTVRGESRVGQGACFHFSFAPQAGTAAVAVAPEGLGAT